MTPAVKPGDKITILMSSGRYIGRSFVSSVADVPEEGKLLLYMPIDRGGLFRLPVGDKILCRYAVKKGKNPESDLYQMCGTVLENLIRGGLAYTRVAVRDCERVQRRAFYRLPCLLDFTFSALPEKAGDGGGEDGKEPPVLNGIIRNLSGGGMYFVSKTELPAEARLLCRLDLGFKELSVHAGIIEKENPSHDDGLYKYRVAFEDMDYYDREDLVRFIYDMQFKMLKKLRENEE